VGKHPDGEITFFAVDPELYTGFIVPNFMYDYFCLAQVD
jgi:hypothetical protein